MHGGWAPRLTMPSALVAVADSRQLTWAPRVGDRLSEIEAFSATTVPDRYVMRKAIE